MSVEIAYLAGFFDGEGSLGHWQTGRGRRSFSLSLANTNLAVLQDFQARFGGSVCEKPPSHASNRLQKKMMWQWRVWGETAWEAYYVLEPYLREKRWKQEPKF